MGDVFKEQLVKRMPTTKDTFKKAGLLGGCFFITFVVLLLLPQFLPVAVLALGFGLYYAFGMMRKEYEYIFTNGELDIDCIYGKSRRKRMFSCDMKQVFLMAHPSRRDADADFATAASTLDFSSGPVSENIWYLLALQEGKRVKVIFEPNEMMYNAIKTHVSPRKIYKQQ